MSVIDFILTVRQQKMLRAILVHPERQYGTNELIAISGPGYGAGRRVLHEFERSGVVIVTTTGNQRLYQANTRHSVYPELRAICRKTFGVSDTIAVELAEFEDRIVLAFVFGSVARGTERADSDIDLMIVGRLDYLELGPVIERLCEAIGRPIDLNLHTEEEWELGRDDPVIRSILEGARLVVIKGTFDFTKAVQCGAQQSLMGPSGDAKISVS